MPKISEDPNAPLLDLCGLRILVLVDMFLSNVSEYSFAACGSIQVPTNVARFNRALPSSMASSWTIWYAVSGSISPSGMRSLGTDPWPGRANIGLTERSSEARGARPT
jgi:hypothetical protein